MSNEESMTDREINEFLAEKLMGYRDTETTFHALKRSFHPVSNITQALGDGGPGTVVGELCKLGFYVEISITDTESLVIINKEAMRIADTPARAISLAAVEALKSMAESLGELVGEPQIAYLRRNHE